MPKLLLNQTLYTIEETAELLEVSKRTITTYLRDKRIQAQRIGRRWYFTEESIKDFIQGKRPQE